MLSRLGTRTLTGKSQILRILEHDRLYAAYAIGHLAAPLFAHCQWVVAESDAGPCALAMTYSGLPVPSVFVVGGNEGIAALLGQRVTPHQMYIVLRPEHTRALAGYYAPSEERAMWRMAVSAATFRPVAADVVRLKPADLPVANELYAWGGPDFLSYEQLAQGVYYAVAHGSRLLAAAGTHIVAPEYGIAAVGNVYTAPEQRNHGYATACTSAVVGDLLARGCRDIVLNVRQDNEPAIRAYARLGFHIHCPFIEMQGRRRSALQRLLHRPAPSPAASTHQE